MSSRMISNAHRSPISSSACAVPHASLYHRSVAPNRNEYVFLTSWLLFMTNTPSMQASTGYFVLVPNEGQRRVTPARYSLASLRSRRWPR